MQYRLSPRQPKVKGLSPETIAGTGKEKMDQKFLVQFL